MIEMQLELVNKALENAGFPPLNKVGDRFYFHDIRELWEDGKDESYNINKFKLLLSENIIDESDVLFSPPPHVSQHAELHSQPKKSSALLVELKNQVDGLTSDLVGFLFCHSSGIHVV